MFVAVLIVSRIYDPERSAEGEGGLPPNASIPNRSGSSVITRPLLANGPDRLARLAPFVATSPGDSLVGRIAPPGHMQKLNKSPGVVPVSVSQTPRATR